MKQTTLSVRMDEELKNEFDNFCADVGMNASVAINLFIKTVVRERRIPFEITNMPSGKTVSAIKAVEKELQSGQPQGYDTVDSMAGDLLK